MRKLEKPPASYFSFNAFDDAGNIRPFAAIGQRTDKCLDLALRQRAIGREFERGSPQSF